MEAGHLGAGPEMSIGLNILLPFEQSANTVMTGNDKLMTMRYFFTRKLMFIKESHAIVLFPGGFGTHDEGFEALTLIQTGKSHLIPIVMVDQPGGTYWKDWEEFTVNELLGNQLISPADVHLYHITESVDHAVEVVTRFYQNYHSYRYVNHYLMIRLLKPLHPAAIEKLNLEFQDILVDGEIVPAEADPLEASDPELMHLPRLKLHFDRKQHGRLRMLFDEINNSPTL
ncbi:MAG: LOG family protein [Zavarzinella sp.]